MSERQKLQKCLFALPGTLILGSHARELIQGHEVNCHLKSAKVKWSFFTKYTPNGYTSLSSLIQGLSETGRERKNKKRNELRELEHCETEADKCVLSPDCEESVT